MGHVDDEMGIRRLSLRFHGKAVETGFVKHNSQRMCSGLLMVGATLFITSSAFLVPTCTINPSRCLPKNKLPKRLSDILLALIGLVLMATMYLQRRRPYLSDRVLERIAAFGSVVILIVGAAGELSSKMNCETYLLLFIDTCVTVAHIALPVRWCLLWPLEIVALLLYPVWTQTMSVYDTRKFGLATPISHLTVMGVLVIVTAWGKRNTEMREREVYRSLIKERTLRVQGDFRISQQIERRPLGRPASVDSATEASRSVFGEGPGSDTSIKKPAGRLEKLADLGRREHWLLDMKDIAMAPTRKLGKGQGGSATVEGTCHGLLVAIKVSRPPRAIAQPTEEAKEEDLAAVISELRVLRQIKHPHIASFYGAVVDTCLYEVGLVLEYVHGPALSDFVRRPDAGDCLGIFIGVAHALQYLHRLRAPIVHGDLRPSKVLVEVSGADCQARPKLVGVGASRRLTASSQRRRSPVWLAPEVVAGERAGPLADTFAFGMLAFFTCTAGAWRPFDGKSDEEVRCLIASGQRQLPECPENLSPLMESVWAIAAECSVEEPELRPEMRNVAEHFSEQGVAHGFRCEAYAVPDNIKDLEPWSRAAIIVRDSTPVSERVRKLRSRRGKRGRSRSGAGSSCGSGPSLLGRVDEDSEAAFDPGSGHQLANPADASPVASETVAISM